METYLLFYHSASFTVSGEPTAVSQAALFWLSWLFT